MKRPFITSLFLILALTSMAQASKSYITPDWKHIEQLCTSRPDSIRLLVERVATPTPEQPPTMAECVLAYCGQSYISLGKETVNEQKMNKALQNKETAKAIQLADKVLAVNPLNLSALLVKAQLCRDGWPFATDTPVPKNTGYGALLVFQRLLEAIAATVTAHMRILSWSHQCPMNIIYCANTLEYNVSRGKHWWDIATFSRLVG